MIIWYGLSISELYYSYYVIILNRSLGFSCLMVNLFHPKLFYRSRKGGH